MSSSVTRCPGCGSSNIVDDDLYCQAQRVCVDCGSVVSEGISYSRTTAVARKPCLNLIKGLQRVKAICRILRVNNEIENHSQTYYTQAYQHEAFIRVSLQKKEVLAGCCVLVSCRLLNWPITMGTISCLLDADPVVVGAVYQEMIKILNIKAPVFIINDVMEAHSQEYKISSLHVPEAGRELEGLDEACRGPGGAGSRHLDRDWPSSHPHHDGLNLSVVAVLETQQAPPETHSGQVLSDGQSE
ncbi:Transcription factor IIIB 50 kDa subunit [Dissostichus eleginoides]|uniref:Transcription factor IIIB 50 kDa subunit n=1 Tax=Dissostichus eleginoides TaxID=100907 RepID=A0AAD9BGX2_DISEL|nr:Transcription factor IIIB 50 kDa subunit [Dissostichus eleginoides]